MLDIVAGVLHLATDNCIFKYHVQMIDILVTPTESLPQLISKTLLTKSGSLFSLSFTLSKKERIYWDTNGWNHKTNGLNHSLHCRNFVFAIRISLCMKTLEPQKSFCPVHAEVYLEPNYIYMMEHFFKIVTV